MPTKKTAGTLTATKTAPVTTKKGVFDADPAQTDAGSCSVVKVDGNDVYLKISLSENPPVSDSGKSYILANMNLVLEPKYKFGGSAIRISGNVMAKLPKGAK